MLNGQGSSSDDSSASTPQLNLLRSGYRFLRDFLSFAGKRAATTAVFVVFGAFLESVSLVLIIPLLSVVTASSAGGGRLQAYSGFLFALAGASSRFEKLALLLAVFGLVILARALVIAARDVRLAELQIGFVEAQRASVMKRLAESTWDRVVRLRHARVTHVMSGDVQRIGVAAHFLLQCSVAVVMLATQCVLAFVLSPILASLACALLLIGAFALVPMLRRAREVGRYVTAANLELLNTTSQFLGGLKLAISQNLQTSFTDEFRETLNALTFRQVENIRHQTTARVAVATLSALVAAVAVLIGVGMLDIAPAVLITLLLILTRMTGPVTQIQQGGQQIAHSLAAYEKVKELEAELAPSVDRSDGAAPLPSGPIVFRNVSFSHAGEANGATGVDDLDLTIAPSSFLGVAGPSGAGKTTLVDLLVGLFPPQAGEVTVGGVPLVGASLAAWRNGVSYVSQDQFLFHDTVRRNLSWADPKATEEDMWRALALAGADGLVRQMELGLETKVGERGTLVSGGERQRIAFARAILRKPRLLVLDEATSAIDLAGEREILKKLLALVPRPTIVMVAHRSESLAFCDQFVTLERGRLVKTPVSGLLGGGPREPDASSAARRP